MASTAKTAIVTGASRGIGAGLVEAFLQAGLAPVLLSQREETARERCRLASPFGERT